MTRERVSRTRTGVRPLGIGERICSGRCTASLGRCGVSHERSGSIASVAEINNRSNQEETNHLHIDNDVCFFLLRIHSLKGGPGGSSITVIQVILSARNIRSRQETKAF